MTKLSQLIVFVERNIFLYGSCRSATGAWTIRVYHGFMRFLGVNRTPCSSGSHVTPSEDYVLGNSMLDSAAYCMGQGAACRRFSGRCFMGFADFVIMLGIIVGLTAR